MGAHNLVTVVGTESLTEGVAIHAYAFGVGLAKESVEEGWGDPWLKDLPATDVGTGHGLLDISSLGKECKGCSDE